MSFCIYRVNSTGKHGVDVDSKFLNGRRDGYTVLECGLKSKEELAGRVKELDAEHAAK